MGKRKNSSNSVRVSSSEHLQSLEVPFPLPPNLATVRAGISQSDRKMIRERLGYFPGNAVSVNGRDSSDKPTVLKLYPLSLRKKHNGKRVNDNGGKKGRKSRKRGHDDGTGDGGGGVKDWSIEVESSTYIIEPFPTTHWLLCPTLKAAISRLEAASETSVTAAEKRLAASTDGSLDSFKAANVRTGKDRWGMLSEEHAQEITRRNWRTLFADRGVGGMQEDNFNEGRVKCLHMQYADHIGMEHSEGNVVGLWALQMLEDLEENKPKELPKPST